MFLLDVTKHDILYTIVFVPKKNINEMWMQKCTAINKNEEIVQKLFSVLVTEKESIINRKTEWLGIERVLKKHEKPNNKQKA